MMMMMMMMLRRRNRKTIILILRLSSEPVHIVINSTNRIGIGLMGGGWQCVDSKKGTRRRQTERQADGGCRGCLESTVVRGAGCRGIITTSCCSEYNFAWNLFVLLPPSSFDNQACVMWNWTPSHSREEEGGMQATLLFACLPDNADTTLTKQEDGLACSNTQS